MVKKFNDLSGKRFGKLCVIARTDDYVSPGGHKLIQYDCLCDCGNHRNVIASALTSGKTKACEECTVLHNFVDLTGQQFGHLTVLRQIENYVSSGGNSFVQYECKCDCGNIKNVTALKLRSGHTKSCGKCGIFDRHIDLIGRKFDRLTVLTDAGEYTYPDGSHDTRWLCKCDCGREIIIRGNSLKQASFGHMCEYCRRHKRNDWLDMVGRRSGRLVVVSRADDVYTKTHTVKDRWNCLCDCGREIVVDGTRIRHQYTKSCGCARIEALYVSHMSSYEVLVSDYLTEHAYKYVPQKTFDGLIGVNGGLLPYDFFIDDDVKLLIECQGEQHYRPVEIFDGTNGFNIRQKHDTLKFEYALSHDIPLLQLNCRTERSENDILLDLDLFFKSHIG